MLAILMIALIFTQPSWIRFYAAVVFVLVNALFNFAVADITDGWYYVVAGYVDLMVMVALLPAAVQDKMSNRLMWICITSIGLNIAGCIAWYNFQRPTLYNLSYVVLYVWAILTLVMRDTADAGNNMGNNRMARILFGIRPDRDSSNRIHEKIV